MWRKSEEPKPASPVAEVPPLPHVETVRSVAGLTAEVVQPSGGVITSSLLIKGEIRGREDLYIDGEVQGTIHLTDGRVTVGPHGKVSADVDAREIVVRGKVKGALRGRERVEVGRTGEVRGDIATLRIAIEEGAQAACASSAFSSGGPAARFGPGKFSSVFEFGSSAVSAGRSTKTAFT